MQVKVNQKEINYENAIQAKWELEEESFEVELSLKEEFTQVYFNDHRFDN